MQKRDATPLAAADRQAKSLAASLNPHDAREKSRGSLRRVRATSPGTADALGSGMLPFEGLFGRPYIDLEPYIDGKALAALDDEICLALTRLPVEYTGGSHKWMGIVPPSLEDEPYIDYGQVIEKMTRAEAAAFIALAHEPWAYDIDRFSDYEWGEERDNPLSREQVMWLKFKHGVYFPWKSFVEMIPNDGWEDKSGGAGKSWTDDARVHFPNLIKLVETLPFREIGRCNLLGLEANDHGTVHCDGEKGTPADHFITLCPRGNKRLFLWDEEAQRKHFVKGHAYWFNDHDYHGVEADPFYRYSIRVDGVFEPAFVETLERDAASR